MSGQASIFLFYLESILHALSFKLYFQRVTRT